MILIYSFHNRSKDRSLSMSLRNEKNELKDTMKKIKYEDKYINVYQKVDELQEKLVKERKKNYDLRKTMESMQKKIDKNEKYVKKIKEIKQDYNDLLDSFEKSWIENGWKRDCNELAEVTPFRVRIKELG